MKDVPEFLEMLKESMNFPSPPLSAEFSNILKQMTDECINTKKDVTSTIYGNLDQKTALYGIVHCKCDKIEDTLSVFYTIHTLSTEFEGRNVQPSLWAEEGFKEEVQLDTTYNYIATAAAKELADIGIDIRNLQPSLQAEEGFKEEVQLETTDNYIATSAANIGIDIQLNIGSG